MPATQFPGSANVVQLTGDSNQQEPETQIEEPRHPWAPKPGPPRALTAVLQDRKRARGDLLIFTCGPRENFKARCEPSDLHLQTSRELRVETRAAVEALPKLPEF